MRSAFLVLITCGAVSASDPMACDADSSSLLQARSQVRKLQMQRSKNADELLKSLQEAALSFTKDATATMTPAEVNEAIGTANEVLETMFPTFTAQHEGAQREIEHAIGVVQGCHDMHGGDESVRLQLAVARSEVANDECQQALDEAVANEHEVCAGQEDDPNCLCDEARQAATAETALCAVVYENHQAVYCDNYHSCTSFAECHARETEAYGLLRVDIEDAMQTRQQQYRTYMQSNCLLNLITTAITAGTPIPPASLVACSDVDLDDLTLTFPNPPEGPAQCPADQDCHLEEPPAISGAISHGSMVHLRNQYGPRHYLDTCGHNSCGGAGQFNVVASPSRTRGAGTGTWEMIKTSGSGAISHGDHVHIRNQYGTKNYLDTCDHASCGGGYNVITHLENNRGNHMTGTWEIVRENGEEGPLVHGDMVHLQNQYNDKTWLDTCGHASCGGGYEVSTHAVRNRGNHRTGSWEILLVDPPAGYTMVHGGHCASGWISGSNTMQASIEACVDQCRSNSQCGYFAFAEVLQAGQSTNCALYTFAGGCTDDNNFAHYTAYQLQVALPPVSLRNGNLEEGLQAGVGGQFAPDYEYTHDIAGWTGSGGTVVCLSSNAPWGGVVSEGSYYLALQASGAAIEQSVSGHRIGHQYTLRLSAAQRQNSPGGRNAVLKITANGVELLNELITSATFVERVVTYTATSASVAIRLENIVGSGDQTVFVDDMRLAPQVDPRSAVIQVDGCYDQGADPHRVVSHVSDGRTAAIRCCSLAGDACPISGACTGGRVLFAAAFNECEARGLRLCTETEIETRVCCSTGCGPDSDQIWVAP